MREVLQSTAEALVAVTVCWAAIILKHKELQAVLIRSARPVCHFAMKLVRVQLLSMTSR